MGFGNIQKIIGKGGGKNTVVVMFKKDISVSGFILPQVKITNTDAVRMYTVADNRVRTRYGIGGQHNKIGIVFT